MTDRAQWQQANDAYLEAALHWLRLRMERFIQSVKPTAKEHAPAAMDSLAAAAQRMTDTASGQPAPALVYLSQRFRLTQFEQEVLLLCAAMDLDTRVASLCALAQDDPNRNYPTFALALALFEDPAWEVLSPERPLRYWRFVEINQPGHQSLTTSPLRADERIVNYIKGLNYLDDRLVPLVTLLDSPATPLPPSQETVASTIARQLEQPGQRRRLPVILLAGRAASSKQQIAGRVSAELGLHLYRLPAELLPAASGDLETLARLWHRESMLLPLALFLDAHDLDKSSAAEGLTAPIHRFLTRSHGFFFLDAREPSTDLTREIALFDVAKPTAREQRDAWSALLGPDAGAAPALLAGQFNLDKAAVQRIVQAVLAEASANPEELAKKLWDRCVAETRPRLGSLAQRLDPKATWEDLVVSEAELTLLWQIANQVRHRDTVYDDWGFERKMNRGLGISVLFVGESGTGKTMAAEVLANDLSLDLYRIDLSAVVSKYIGETEKNLRRLFDAAEDGGAILFFDEADALFGKRTEVKDSHDRYANIEVNYLLQRMEAYRGLAILATNMKSALDPAFVRRLRAIVPFACPGPVERRAIWERAFPRETPTRDLDYDRLARLNLKGGSIHSIAVNAAFLAAQQGKPVTMRLVLDAARTEFRKQELPIREADFRWQEPVGVVA